MSTSLQGKTLFITGGSRGIGLAIGARAACEGANVAIAAKSVTENPKIPGTIYSAAKEIENAGGKALAIPCDIRFEDQVLNAMAATAEKFGGIDILVNNASAIDLRGVDKLDMGRFDLMQNINARGTYMCAKHALPYLEKSDNPHILTLSPPPSLDPTWWSPNLAYSLAKMGMSLVTLGLAPQLAPKGIAANSLWPETMIATAAVGNLLGGEAAMKRSRSPDIMADAAAAIFKRAARETTGQFFIDVRVLAAEGVTDFAPYRADPTATEPLLLDYFLDAPITPGVIKVPASAIMKLGVKTP